MFSWPFVHFDRSILVTHHFYKPFVSAAFIALLSGTFTSGTNTSRAEQASRDNGCVECHSALTTPAEMSSRFLDWRASAHKVAGVYCDKCHGGDPTAREKAKAHRGILPSSNKDSRLHEMNAPETCGRCHRVVVNAFVESEHYQRLKASGLGPSCINCHHHMAASVARAPVQVESLCTFCHNTVNGLLPQEPDLVRKAKTTLDAIARTNYMIAWIDELLAQAEKKKLDVEAEKESFRQLKNTLAEAKTSWHAFRLETPAAKAEKSFEEAVKVRDSLSRKLARASISAK